METLKRHWLLLLLTLLLMVSLPTAVYRCSRSHGGSGGAASPTPNGEATEVVNPWTDPTTIGTIITAVISALGIAWKALKRRDPGAAIDALAGLKDTMRDTIKQGVPLMPSEETFAVSIARLMGNPEEPTALQRALAKDLMGKYTITVKP